MAAITEHELLLSRRAARLGSKPLLRCSPGLVLSRRRAGGSFTSKSASPISTPHPTSWKRRGCAAHRVDPLRPLGRHARTASGHR